MMNRREFLEGLFSVGAMLVPIRLMADKIPLTEVLIVGSGPAGISLADRLTALGISVLVIETGSNHETRQNMALSTVLDGGGGLPYDLSRAGVRVVGGGSNVWGGICPRLQPSDFSTRSKYGYGRDWPIAYDDMARFYCQAENWLKVTGGKRRCLNAPPSPHDVAAVSLLKKLDEIGINNSSAARISSASNGTNSPVRLRTQRIPHIVKRASFGLLTGLTARKIVVNDVGKASGVIVSSLSGEEYRIKGQVIVLAAGAIQNSRLLMLSDSVQHKGGLGNGGGHLGRWFMEHQNIHYWLKPNKSYITANFAAAQTQIMQWYDKSKEEGVGSVLCWASEFKYAPARSAGFALPDKFFMLEALCEQEPSYENALSLSHEHTDQFGDPLPVLNYRRTHRDEATMHIAEKLLDSIAEDFSTTIAKQPINYGSHHLMGTTRMGGAEKDGVVDLNLKVHGIRNLYVAGSSVFVTGGAANPTLSITALSLRLAEYLYSIRNR